MTTHTLLATESTMLRMTEDAEKHVQISRPVALQMKVGDVVQFKYNGDAGDADWLTPPRTIGYIHATWIELAPEETFIKAQRRWRREEKDDEIARKQKSGAESAFQTLPAPPPREVLLSTPA